MSEASRTRGDPHIVVCGRRAVLEALRHPSAAVLEVATVRDAPRDFLRALTAACREADTALSTVSRAEVQRLSREPRHDQGVAARVRLAGVTEVESLLERAKGRAARAPLRLLALDRITNPQNIGMIIRSAVAAGMSGLLWPLHGSPWVSGLVVKASAAALYDCPIVRCTTLQEGLVALQAGGFAVCGLTAEASHSLFEWIPPHRAVFVVGGETSGLSDDTRELLDEALAIPLAGGVESLNVAVAASLVCFRASLMTPGSEQPSPT